MAADNKFKYAIVRLPETSILDFFTLIMTKGYSDVSFVSNLGQCQLREDPNDDPTSIRELNDDDSTSENNKSSPTPRRSSVLQAQQQQQQQHLLVPPGSSTSTNQMVSDGWLFSNLFGKPVDLDIVGATPSSSDWAGAGGVAADLRVKKDQTTSRFSPYANNSAAAAASKTSQDPNVQTRMKGWQREYIKEVINNGHYPTEEELRDIEMRCDLSRKQVLRFIAKRLVNPNRKPRNLYQSAPLQDAIITVTDATTSANSRVIKDEDDLDSDHNDDDPIVINDFLTASMAAMKQA